MVGLTQTNEEAMIFRGLYPMGRDNPSVTDVRRSKTVRGVYVSDARMVQRRPKYHDSPVCSRIMKSIGKDTTRMNLQGLEGKVFIVLEPDIGRYVTPCTTCVGKTNPLSRDWVKYAACRDQGVDRSGLFVNPNRKGGPGEDRALDICSECPVVLHCRDYGATVEQPRGSTVVWGGETQKVGV